MHARMQTDWNFIVRPLLFTNKNRSGGGGELKYRTPAIHLTFRDQLSALTAHGHTVELGEDAAHGVGHIVPRMDIDTHVRRDEDGYVPITGGEERIREPGAEEGGHDVSERSGNSQGTGNVGHTDS